MESLNVNLLDSISDEYESKSRKVFSLLLESCWDHFYLYLLNEDRQN